MDKSPGMLLKVTDFGIAEVGNNADAVLIMLPTFEKFLLPAPDEAPAA